MAHILVTGAGGYIGSITAKLLLEAGHTILALDNFSRGYREPLEKLKTMFGEAKLSIVEADLVSSRLSEILASQPVEAVAHFAALLNVGESMLIPHKYFTNNIIGTQRLLEACIDAGVPYFLFSGSCTVYGNAQYLPIDEAHPLEKPQSVYGATKLMNEQMLEWYSNLKKITYISLRYFNVCGATDDGEFGDSKRPSFHLVQNAVLGAMGLRPFTLNYATVNTPDGSPIRDYVHVVDLADAHVRALDFLFKEKRSEVFNIGTGSGNSVLEIVHKVKELTGKDFPVIPDQERRMSEADKMVADYKKAKELLGWEPQRTLHQAVESLVAWYSKHPQGWRS